MKIEGVESSVDGGSVDRDLRGAKGKQIPNKHLLIDRSVKRVIHTAGVTSL